MLLRLNKRLENILMRSTPALLLFSILLAISVLCYSECRGFCADDGKRILLLNSYHQGFGWTDNITSGVKSVFTPQNDADTLYIENMDSKNFHNQDLFPSLYTLYWHKYRNKQPDVIICSDNNALTFLITYRQKLFPGIPIVFCGINNFSESMLSGEKNITGIVEKVSDLETVEMALKLHPQAQTLHALACSAPTSKEHIKRFRVTSKDLSDKIKIQEIHDLTKSEYAEALSKVSPNDIILNFGFHHTLDDYTPSLSQAYNFIRQYTQAPVYTLWRSYADYATAGIMIDGYTQGRIAAEIASRILAGTPASQIPIITESPNIPILNFTDLQRLGKLDLLQQVPADAVIIHQPFSVYKEYKWIIWPVIVTLIGMAILIFFLAQNITKRRQAEQNLRQKQEILQKQKENLRVTLSSIAEGVIVTNTAGLVQQLNPVAEILTGYTTAEALGRHITEVFSLQNNPNHKPIYNPIEQALASPDFISHNNLEVLTSRDKTEYQISESTAPIRSDDGKIIGAILIFRDVTKENALQTQLHHSQKMDAIGQLAGGIAHDFNNMLGGITSAADLAKMLIDDKAETLKFIDIILDAADRAASLTSQLLTFSRQQPKSSTPIDINKILKSSISLLSSTIDKRISVHNLLSEGELNIIGDPSLMQSAFINLLINASHAMPEGGDIFIRSDTVFLDENYCSASTFNITPGEYVQIEIRDTGHGIQQEHINKIFEPFFTTKEVGKGTGLGLAAVLGTIEQHKGSIAVYSEKDIGTSFHILLPLTEQNHLRNKPLPERQLSGLGTILVVDDENIMRITAKAILEQLGYSVLLAADGEEAIEIFRQHAATIDLVILDMIMPKLNGRDCFFKLHQLAPEKPIIISSGFSRPEELSELNKSGLSGFIRKPFRAVNLAEIIKDTLCSLPNRN